MNFSLNKLYFKTLWPLFMDGVQLPQSYRATSRRQFTFYHQVPRESWYSFAVNLLLNIKGRGKGVRQKA